MFPFKKKKKEDGQPAWWSAMKSQNTVEQAGEHAPAHAKEGGFDFQESSERIQLVADKLTERYKDYSETRAFIGFLASTEEIFSRAILEKWDAQKTESELIESEIYLMSVSSGIDEKVFRVIYKDFQELSHRAHTVQTVAKQLIDKYHDCESCVQFISYVRDFVLIFSQNKEVTYTLPEHKEEVIRARMRVITSEGKPPLHVLEEIYKEFQQLCDGGENAKA